MRPASDNDHFLRQSKREVRKVGKQSRKVQHMLDDGRFVERAVGHSAGHETNYMKKRVMSAAGKPRISKTANEPRCDRG
jgi:hypothetical protein